MCGQDFIFRAAVGVVGGKTKQQQQDGERNHQKRWAWLEARKDGGWKKSHEDEGACVDASGREEP